MTDVELTRSLARLMGWEVYTEREGRYDRWQRHLVNDGGAGSCFIDLDGKVWIYDGASVYINAHERLWRPLHDMNDAMQITQKLRSDGWEYAFGSCPEGDYAHFSHYERRDNQPWPTFRNVTADGLARAICLAALQVQEASK